MFRPNYLLRNAEPGQEGSGSASRNPPASTVTPAAGAPAAVTVEEQARIDAALAKREAEFAEQLKAATGHSDLKSLTEEQLKAQGKLQELADAKASEAQVYKNKYEQAAVNNALLAASTDAVNPELVKDLLTGKAAVDANGTVTVAGKPVAEAVKQLLADHPYLAKAQGGTGSGAPNAGGFKAEGQNEAPKSSLQRLADAYKSN